MSEFATMSMYYFYDMRFYIAKCPLNQISIIISVCARQAGRTQVTAVSYSYLGIANIDVVFMIITKIKKI